MFETKPENHHFHQSYVFIVTWFKQLELIHAQSIMKETIINLYKRQILHRRKQSRCHCHWETMCWLWLWQTIQSITDPSLTDIQILWWPIQTIQKIDHPKSDRTWRRIFKSLQRQMNAQFGKNFTVGNKNTNLTILFYKCCRHNSNV